MKQKISSPKWYKIFFSIRVRILIWFVLLMVLSAVTSIFVIRHLLLVRQEKRIEKSLIQEIKEFQKVVSGRNPTTGKPFGNDVISIFDKYMSRNFPDDNEFFIALLNGEFYKSDPKIIPESIYSDSQLLEYWAQLTLPTQDKQITPSGTLVYYLAEPVIRGKNHGVMVVVHSTALEHQEVNEAIFLIIQVMLVVLAIVSLLAWVVAGRLIVPLRLLTETARSISESDLRRRIPVKGSDEIAELTVTFNEMLERLETAFSSQRDFINDASHELRTPITIIRGHLELLSDDPEERQETIELVTDELDRMNRFVDDLLLLAKAEQPDFLNLETVDIGALTVELYAKTQALAVRDWRLEAVASCRIVADRQRLTQAIMNLAVNATQHTKEGDVIALGSALIKNRVRLWVRDTGEGIKPKDRKRIFQRFARGSNGRRSDGAGLGLAIVQAIAVAHGGTIKLFSRPKGGSTFTLVLPLEPPQEVLVNEQNSYC
ncbi:sensor histidine kinase [Chlorogloeopsis fritschii]|nr:HAMP domain-containing sensor histidine kinase [Chlorogloeopsis fritschii]